LLFSIAYLALSVPFCFQKLYSMCIYELSLPIKRTSCSQKLPSFHKAGVLCCWNLKLISGGLYSIFQHWRSGSFWLHEVLFMGSDSSYIHIEYNFWKQKGTERAKYAIEKSNLWSGESSRMWSLCWVMLCKAEMKRGCSHPLIFFLFFSFMKSSTSFSWGINIQQPPQEGIGCLKAWSL